MIEHPFRAAGKILLSAVLTACVTACASSTTSSHPAATSPTPSTSPSPSPASVTIPPVAGDSVQIADEALTTASLGTPKNKMEPNIHFAQGEVITTDPAAGASVPTDYVVTLIVSEGVTVCSECTGGGEVLVMPDICRLSIQKADTLLAGKGITLNPRVVRKTSSAPIGSIVSSVPAAGAHFIAYGGPAAREVTVTISSGQTASPGPTPSVGQQNTC
jgi:eukaryotic-like serine/threonine-protein kinase